MLRNYFIIATRNLLSNPLYSFLNVFGLSLGIGICIIVSIFVINQYSYDKHHVNAKNIYRVVNTQQEGGKDVNVALTQGVLAPELLQVFPNITNATRVGFTNGSITIGDAEPTNENLMAVDSSFFSIFTIPFAIEPIGTPLPSEGILLSEKAAARFFPGKNPVGEVVSFPGFVDLKVTGVFKNFPRESHLYADMIISFVWIEKTEPVATSWNSNSYYTYLLMPEDFDKESFDKSMNTFIHEHIPASWKSFTYYTQPLLSINLDPSFRSNPRGSVGKIIMMGFSVVGFIVLFIACLNYMNLSTARSTKRAIEVGVRKVMGAFRSQLIAQFLAESLILCLTSFMLAILWADFGIPMFNRFTGFHLELSNLFRSELIHWLIGCMIVLTLLAGSYPALYLSRFLPSEVLKGQRSSDMSRRIRKGLVIAQFSLTTTLVIIVVVVFKQTQFMQTQNLGFNKEQLLLFTAERNSDISLVSFKAELQKIPGVKTITVASDYPGGRMNTTGLQPLGTPPEESTNTQWTFTDEDYIPTLQLELIAGENFKSNYKDNEKYAIINQTAARAFGWTPQEAIGKKVVGFTFNDSLPGTIIGVTKDFHITSLRQEINPLVIGYADFPNSYMARLDGDDVFNTRKQLEEIASKYVKGGKLESTFLNDALDQTYAAERKTGQVLSVFTILAILLGCTGLYALSAYEGERRIKELGVRKIMGATSSQLLALLSREFLKLIFISILISVPLAYYLGNIWLREYPYKISWTVDIFLLSSFFILLLGWLTILSQTIKASRLNPVEALRYE